MKGFRMAEDWRTIQFFLDDSGVYEVEADADDYQLMRCTCEPFAQSRRCKHVKYIKRSIDENNGLYAIKVGSEVDDDTMATAIADPKLFREFVIKYAKAVVLK